MFLFNHFALVMYRISNIQFEQLNTEYLDIYVCMITLNIIKPVRCIYTIYIGSMIFCRCIVYNIIMLLRADDIVVVCVWY